MSPPRETPASVPSGLDHVRRPMSLPPLAVYVHLPWCVRKCPYCDFNSHARKGPIPERDYITALMRDLELDLPRVWGRTVYSVFIGGGTPSLFSGEAISDLLDGLRARLKLAPHAEITLEANPGTVEHDRFEAYREAGVNRISLGVQSFDDRMLRRLGRIHGGAEAHAAVRAVIDAGFENFNLDLMWGLPGQDPQAMLADLEQALDHAPPHLSHYQLTIEPNTVFASRPPSLPDEDTIWTMQQQAEVRLAAAGYRQYEISAWAVAGHESRHNLNYWRFGDYLGIGAGASGKITLPAEGRVLRTRRRRVPESWLASAEKGTTIVEARAVPITDLPFEYLLNRTRLAERIPLEEFEQLTGLDRSVLAPAIERASTLGLIEVRDGVLERTGRGARYLNDLQALFLPDSGLIALPQGERGCLSG